MGSAPSVPPRAEPTGGSADTGGDADYNLEVELYIFGEETTVAYGGACFDACAAVDLGDIGNSAAECHSAGACDYSPYVPAASEPFTPEISESCIQTTSIDCNAQQVDCPRGVCDPTGCTSAGACTFVPETIPVPANSLKYNIQSTRWPFCGPNNFLSVVVDLAEGAGSADDAGACIAPTCADQSACTQDEEDALSACMNAGTVQATCEAAGCIYVAPVVPDAAVCATADLANTDGTAETEASPSLCPDGCSYSHSIGTDGTVLETCSASTGDISVGDAAGIDVTFKGRSPNVDVCSQGADASCMNIKFGKVTELGPDATRKVNAHSIMSLASSNNLPTWSTGLTSYGTSNAVTFVKMALDRSFSRPCSNSGRDGGVADPSARPRPTERASTIQLGEMVAQMPTIAMISPATVDATGVAPRTRPTNITVIASSTGVEFVFPAFSNIYYDPIVASKESFEGCSACNDWRRTCADTDADGIENTFDCSAERNSLDASPANVVCHADECTADECCTVACELGEGACSGDVPVDCAGTWSDCTALCESAAERTWSETVAARGGGTPCPAAEACELGEGGCVEQPTASASAPDVSSPTEPDVESPAPVASPQEHACGGTTCPSLPCNTVRCDAASRACVHTPVTDGTQCEDGDPLGTQGDVCLSGVCEGNQVFQVVVEGSMDQLVEGSMEQFQASFKRSIVATIDRTVAATSNGLIRANVGEDRIKIVNVEPGSVVVSFYIAPCLSVTSQPGLDSCEEASSPSVLLALEGLQSASATAALQQSLQAEGLSCANPCQLTAAVSSSTQQQSFVAGQGSGVPEQSVAAPQLYVAAGVAGALVLVLLAVCACRRIRSKQQIGKDKADANTAEHVTENPLPVCSGRLAVSDGDWSELIDSTSGRPYYVNKRTGERSWLRPNPESEPTASVSSGDWLEKWDANSKRPYYVNPRTQESRWTRPTGFPTTMTGDNSAAQWVQRTDPGSGRPYFVNVRDRQSVWSLPEGAVAVQSVEIVEVEL